MSGRTFEVRSPADGSVLATLPVHGAGEVRAAVARARAAQAPWAALGPGERARRMGRLARVLADRGDDLAASVRRETGKPLTEALAEVVVSVDLIRFYRRVAPRLLASRRVGTWWLLSKSGRVDREPHGVVAGITPWNYPLIMALDCITPALFAGNGVVLKPSEFTPLTTLLLPGVLEEAGLPAGLVQVVTGDGSTGDALVRAGVDRVVFTGSTATGRKVMAAAAETLTPVTLELGGKDPAIVLEDADLDRAARGVVFGGFFNAGQTCISVERVYVVRSVYEPFVERVADLARSLRAGVGDDADVGPIITPPQRALIVRQLSDALAKGARAVVGGAPADPRSAVVPPTVLVDVTDDMEVLRAETFGPVLPVVAVADEDEAVRRANATAYGLFASVWTGDRRRGLRVARRLRAGGVSVNDVLSHYGVPSLPMGGVGESGFGRRRGVEALEEMTRTRTLLTDRTGMRRELWWFPYSPSSDRLMKAVLEWRGRGGLAGVLGAVRAFLGKES
ncbi:MAG: aldehyde dehydrogenase [Gemmatimonadota bacterium]